MRRGAIARIQRAQKAQLDREPGLYVVNALTGIAVAGPYGQHEHLQAQLMRQGLERDKRDAAPPPMNVVELR